MAGKRASGSTLELRVTPRAAASRIGPMQEGVLPVHVTAAPADGAANRAVVELVARALGVAPTRVSLVAGLRTRRKRVLVAGLTAEEVRARLSREGA